jgi:hypothetical protein
MGAVGDAERRPNLGIRRIGVFAFLEVEIEVRLHAAREQIEVGLSRAPERSDRTAAPVG